MSTDLDRIRAELAAYEADRADFWRRMRQWWEIPPRQPNGSTAARLSAIERAHIASALEGQDRKVTQELIEEGRTRRHGNGT